MAHLDIEFPPGISFGAVGGPRFRTTVVRAKSGIEQRNVDWAAPLYQWEVGHYAYNEGRLRELQSFFLAVQGQAHSFNFKDWTDYCMGGDVDDAGIFQAGEPMVFADGDGESDTFQVSKVYSFGAASYSRPIYLIKSGAKIYLDEVLQESGYTLDLTSGQQEFSSAPGIGVEIGIACEFWLECRFATDEPGFVFESMTTGELPSILVQEVRRHPS